MPGRWCRASPVRGQTARGSCGRSLDALTALQFSRFAEVPVAHPSLQVFLAQGQTTELDHRAPIERHQNPAKPSGLL